MSNPGMFRAVVRAAALVCGLVLVALMPVTDLVPVTIAVGR